MRAGGESLIADDCAQGGDVLDTVDLRLGRILDSGLKEGEQGFNRPSTPAAIIALVCARVLEKGTDISAKVIKYLVAISHY